MRRRSKLGGFVGADTHHPIWLVKAAAREMLEHWNEDFSFGDGREEQYPIDEIQQLNLRRAPKLSDEASDGS